MTSKLNGRRSRFVIWRWQAVHSLGCAVFFVASLAVAQTESSTLIAARAVAGFSTAPVNQIKLVGTVKAYAGSSQPTGTFTATLQSNGESKLQIDAGELSRTETAGPFADPRKCQWAGLDGVVNNVVHHNCLTSVNWLVPIFDLQSRFTKLNSTLAMEQDEGIAVHALSLTQPPGDSSRPAALISRLSTAKLLLDTSTLLPTSLSFNLHPDRDAGIDIPVMVRYSNYRTVNGVMLPFHIQKYLNNNGLALDLQVETAEVQ